MNVTGKFIYPLDLGMAGEHDAIVMFDAYRAKRKAEDDYDEMTINSVVVDLNGKLIELVGELTDGADECIKEAAWGEVPSKDEILTERADYYRSMYREVD